MQTQQTWKNTVLLRIEEEFYDLISSEISAWIDPEKPKLAVRERGEDDDNPHQHWFFHLQEGKKLSAFRSSLNRKGFKGNEMYSLKAGKPKLCDSHLDYLCKGITSQEEDDVDIITRSKDFDDTVIAQRHEVYHKIHAYLPEKKRKRELNASKLIGYLEVTMRKKQKVPLPRAEMHKLAMRWYYENKTTINVHHLRTVTNHVSYGITMEEDLVDCPETQEHFEYVEKMQAQLFNKIE
ncbi:MAG: putative replicase [Cressdnaviricota sp.]|nr:MAG: putative replicase [Cressdnaviricota sp.]